MSRPCAPDCKLCAEPLPEVQAPLNAWHSANLRRLYESQRKAWREQNDVPLGGWGR